MMQCISRARVRRPATRLGALAVVLVCAGAAALAYAAPPTMLLDASSIGNGSAVTAANSCSRLFATIGEPVAGFSSGGAFALGTGFQTIAAAGPSDTLFFDGFEGCKP